MFPVSGAAQLSTSGASQGQRPVISARGAYSRSDKPAPHSSPGMNRFHRPSRRASAFNSSTIGGWKYGSPAARICSSYTGSAG